MRARRKLAALGALALGAMVAVAPLGPPAGAGHAGGPYFDLAQLPPTDVTGPTIFAGLEDFVSKYPYRLTGGPTEILAANALRDEMAGIGYESTIQSLPPAAGAPAAPLLRAVVATKRGTTLPDEWIMFVGHYDTVPQTIDGAYDNAAGTNFIRHLAHEFKNVPTNRSLVFVWYNGEEEGVLASARHAALLQAAGQKITAVLGFDMVGISYPVAPEKLNTSASYCLCFWHGPADQSKFKPLMRYVHFTFLGLPEGSKLVSYAGVNNRNSDERSFANAGYPTMRWAGMRTASSYPAYHRPDDTIAKIVEVAGGETYYEQGIENTLKGVYYTTLAIDNHFPLASATVERQEGASVDFSGLTSSDADGVISSYEWDFGDGTTADTATPSHTFAAPGTYTVTLTVTDNLWPSVTRTATVQVTV